MANEQAEFWSKVAQSYDRVVDAQIGPKTRLMIRERVAEEAQLGHLAEFGCGTGFYTQVLVSKAHTWWQQIFLQGCSKSRSITSRRQT